MKFKGKKLLTIILAIAIYMSNMMGTSASKATTESDAKETIYTEEATHYSLANMGYDQTIEPGQTINFGFIGGLLEGNDAKFENEILYRLTVYPYEEDEELNEDDYIWEGDVEDDVPMSVVEDEVFDEDDYDRVEEDELAKEVIRKKMYNYLQVIGVLVLLLY